jgi:hypothetical protein
VRANYRAQADFDAPPKVLVGCYGSAGASKPLSAGVRLAADDTCVMGTSKHWVFAVGLAAAVLSIMAWTSMQACSRTEQPHRFYSQLTQAVAAGEVTRGWLPAWVPQGARAIHIQSDLDTNRWWVRFTLPPEEARKLRSVLESIPDSDVAQLVEVTRPAYGDWWFGSLVQNEPANDGAFSADFFHGQVRGHQCYVAFDRVEPEVYVWGDE